MRIAIDIVSPTPFYSSLTHPVNSLCVNPASLDRVRYVSSLYQSPITNLPVHRGPIFSSMLVIKKPKLMKSIGSLHLKVKMSPLVLGLMHEMEENEQSGVGVRAKAQNMDIDLMMGQHLVRQINEELGGVQRIKRTLTQWKLETSEVGFTELEGRAVSFGDAHNILCKDEGVEPNDMLDMAGEDLEEREEDLNEWLLDEDFQYVDDASKLRMTGFIWSPKITYFKRTEGDTYQIEDKMKSEGYIFGEQISLFRGRLRELEASIRHHVDVQRGLEARIAMCYDEGLKQQSAIVVEKLCVLYEKKIGIEAYIKQCERDQSMEESPEDTGTSPGGNFLGAQSASMSNSFLYSNDALCIGKNVDVGLFDHYYVIHNINLLWKKDVRNTLFKLFDLQSKNNAIKVWKLGF
jgi:hypothetical protein